jgi:hypothetical protein
MNCSVDICRITSIFFITSTENLKGLCVLISKLRSEMYIILLYSLTMVKAKESILNRGGFQKVKGCQSF